MTQTPQLVAISGLPGAGKTTLCLALAKRLPTVRLFHYDQYETITKRAPAELQAWIARGADPDEINLDRLVADIAEAKARTEPGGGYIILDTPLGRLHRETSRLIDHAIWIALPAALALARQIGSQADGALRSPDDSAARQFAGWLSGFLQGYEAFIHDISERQTARARQESDLVIDGRQPVEALADSVAAWLEARRHGDAALARPVPS